MARTSTDALFCDEYELTMASSFWRHQQDEETVFELSVRQLPAQRGYLVVAGLDPALDYLEDLHFDDDDLRHLGRLGFDDGFLEHLATLRFSGSVSALPEGTVIGSGVPLLQIRARRIEATLVETALLSIINHQTLIASKAARIVQAAAPLPVWDYSLRRLHGIDAGLGVARASYIAGCTGSATVAAGARYGVPTAGTMAHHFVMRFGEEHEQVAFEQFLRDFPARGVLLVDTYDTDRGVRRAVAAAQATGIPLRAVRIDSGDLNAACRRARRILDEAGRHDTGIILSGDLDEHRIEHMLADGAPATSFGVGTRLGTSEDAPALGGIYKLVAERIGPTMRPVMKRSAGKHTEPGVHQVWRTADGLVLALADEPMDGTPLLVEVMHEGRRLAAPAPLADLCERCAAELAALPATARRLVEPVVPTTRRSPGLQRLIHELSHETARDTVGEPA